MDREAPIKTQKILKPSINKSQKHFGGRKAHWEAPYPKTNIKLDMNIKRSSQLDTRQTSDVLKTRYNKKTLLEEKNLTWETIYQTYQNLGVRSTTWKS